MLVVRLKLDQVVRIGPDVLVMLVRGDNGALTLGIVMGIAKEHTQ